MVAFNVLQPALFLHSSDRPIVERGRSKYFLTSLKARRCSGRLLSRQTGVARRPDTSLVVRGRVRRGEVPHGGVALDFARQSVAPRACRPHGHRLRDCIARNDACSIGDHASSTTSLAAVSTLARRRLDRDAGRRR